MQFQEYVDEPSPPKKNFPHKAFCLFVTAEMFLEVALFLETYSVLKTGCTPCEKPWLADKGNVWVSDQLEHSLSQ